MIGVLDRTTAAKNMPPRALITGATGQDGSYLVELLLARDYQVHAQSRRSDSTSLPQHGNLHWHTADICDPVVLHTLMAEVQPNEIYNLASISRPSESWQIPRETADTRSEPANHTRSVPSARPHSATWGVTGPIM